MNRNDLQKLSKIRLKESKALLDSGLYEGAYYLAGYSVECAIKACIAKNTKKCAFPDKELAIHAWDHDLEKLVGLAGIGSKLKDEMKANKKLQVNWALVKDWKVDSRYELGISYSQAKDYYSACTTRKDGILSWIKKRW